MKRRNWRSTGYSPSNEWTPILPEREAALRLEAPTLRNNECRPTDIRGLLALVDRLRGDLAKAPR